MNTLIKREYDYAIRICAYLAGYYNKKTIPVSHIAAKLYITKPFTTKIVYQLKKKKILDTVQGKQGGIFLNCPPEELSLFDILDAMEFNFAINECVNIPHICPLNTTCHIHLFFAEQQQILFNNLKSKTIAEFAFDDQNLNPSS